MGGIVISLVFGLITAGMAARKGYHFAAWILAGGILGLIVLAFLPFANKPEQTPEEQAKLKKTGNIIGGAISAVAVALAVFLAIAG